MTPCCAKCGETGFSWTTRSFGGLSGMLVYCVGCGAVVSWVPKPK